MNMSRSRRNCQKSFLVDHLEPRLMMAGDAFIGRVISGIGSSAKPLAHSQVTLYEATEGVPIVRGSATTRANGAFRINVPNTTSSSIFYVTAEIGRGVSLESVLGAKLPKSRITVNEITTVAAGYSMAQFSDPQGDISGDAFGLRIAAGMNNNLVSPQSGSPSPVLLSSPNAYETNSLRTIRSLGNLAASIVQSTGAERALLVSQFYTAATPMGSSKPDSLFEAFANIARSPGENVDEIYSLTSRSATYHTGLFQAPDAFTMAVVVNKTGSNKLAFGGPGQLAFDDNGFAWITNNTIQGSPNSSKFLPVLQPNGAPATGKNGTPKSPIVGGGTLGQGFGIAIDPTTGNIWATNYGWGKGPGNLPGLKPYDSGTGSVSVYSPTGKPLSGPKGYFGYNPTTGEFPAVQRAQGVQVDSQGNVYIASIENNSIVVFPKGDPTKAVSYKVPESVWKAIDPTLNHFQSPFDVRLAADESVWVSFSGDLSNISGPGGFARVKLIGSPGNYTVEPVFTPVAVVSTVGTEFTDNYLHAPKGMVLDSLGNCWITSGPADSMYKVPFDWNDSKDPLVDIKRYSGGGISGPWGAEVDGNDNIWVANFGPEAVGAVYRNPGLSLLAGANPAKRPSWLNEGDPITSSVGYTLPTGSDQVLLANGDPLYGKGLPASYLPLQRMTQVRIDQAGNMWAINNWKPNFTWDSTGEILVGNKAKGGGGNSIVIFVGLGAIKPRVPH